MLGSVGVDNTEVVDGLRGQAAVADDDEDDLCVSIAGVAVEAIEGREDL